MRTLKSGLSNIVSDPLAWIHPKYVGNREWKIKGTARGILNLWLSRSYCIYFEEQTISQSFLARIFVSHWFLVPDIVRCLVAQRFRLDIRAQPNDWLTGPARSYLNVSLLPNEEKYRCRITSANFDFLMVQEIKTLRTYLPDDFWRIIMLMFSEGVAPEQYLPQPQFDSFLFTMALQHVQRFY